MSNIIDLASRENNWQAFLDYKIQYHHLNKRDEKTLRDFIERKAYLPICQLLKDNNFPMEYPVKRIINKQGTSKKRTIYSFSGDVGIFLKFVAFHLFEYDYIFCNNCYSFRRKFGIGNAIRRIKSIKNIDKKYCLKVDISDYFNSIDVELLLSKLTFLKDKDLTLYNLFSRILLEERVLENNKIIYDNHGAMAGTPISPFFANLYLTDVDYYFNNNNIHYFRYSDDIIIFADSLEEINSLEKLLYDKIRNLNLTLNSDKVHLWKPGEEWEFLGFCYRSGDIDLSDTTIRKTKAKIKRKARALRRWQRKKGLSTHKAAIGLINAMNHKFYGKEDSVEDKDFTWCRWFFPYITVDTGLKTLDSYLIQNIRYAVTGRHYKGNYRIRYDQLKEWGYRSLVNEYYKNKIQNQTKNEFSSFLDITNK